MTAPTLAIRFVLIGMLFILLPLSLSAKIKHPIKIPDFDDNDTAETFSVDGSITHFLYNPGSYNARPDLSGTAYNRYYLDMIFERNAFFAEGELSLLTAKENADQWFTPTELDKDLTLGYHLNDAVDLYLEGEHDAPFNRTIRRSYTGAGVRYNMDTYVFGSDLSFMIDVEKVLRNNRYAARPDGTGEANMIYIVHADYNLPSDFSFSTEHHFYTDAMKSTIRERYLRTSEWDQIYQINYQATADLIISLYKEIDSFADQRAAAQRFIGLQVLYEF